MTALQLADRLESMALVAELPAVCPHPCCEQRSSIRLTIWPKSCRDELRLAASMLRGRS